MKSFTSLIILAFAAVAFASPVPQLPVDGVLGGLEGLPVVGELIGGQAGTLSSPAGASAVRRQFLPPDLLGSLIGGNRKRSSVPGSDHAYPTAPPSGLVPVESPVEGEDPSILPELPRIPVSALPITGIL